MRGIVGAPPTHRDLGRPRALGPLLTPARSPALPLRSYLTLLGAPPLPVTGVLGGTYRPPPTRAGAAAEAAAGADPAAAAAAAVVAAAQANAAAVAAQPSPTARIVFNVVA